MRNFFYKNNDIIIVLLILILAAAVIYDRLGLILDYPEKAARTDSVGIVREMDSDRTSGQEHAGDASDQTGTASEGNTKDSPAEEPADDEEKPDDDTNDTAN